MAARLSLDNQVVELSDSKDRTVGDVLTQVVSQLPPNRIVTKVTMNGTVLGQPQVQKSLDLPMEESALEIKTADLEIWKHSGLDVSISCIERVQKSLLRVVELFRDENKAQANQFFVHCVDGLERFLEAITVTRVALKLDFNQIQIDGRPLTLIEADMGAILKAIVAHQESQDYMGVADRLEYELLPNLYAWSRAIRQLRLSQSSNA